MGESFQYFDWFQVFFGKGPESSWDSCKFDEFFQGVRYAFLTEIKKKIERILICVNSRKFSVFVQKNTFTHVYTVFWFRQGSLYFVFLV
jgi:hypothetical protein